MKSPLLSAMLLLTLLTLSAHGQYCSPVERSGFTGGSVSLSTTFGPATLTRMAIFFASDPRPWSAVRTASCTTPRFATFFYQPPLPAVARGRKSCRAGLHRRPCLPRVLAVRPELRVHRSKVKPRSQPERERLI